MVKKILIAAAIVLLVALAIIFYRPPYHQNYERGKQAASKGYLEALQANILIYYNDKEGRWPKKLEDLVPDYIDNIPKERITESSAVVNLKGKPKGLDKEYPDFITGSGGWVYFPQTGEIFLNVKGKDWMGRYFWEYGLKEQH